MGSLTPHSSVSVRFDGKRGGDGPLTMGQLNILNWLARRREPRYATLRRAVEIPPGIRPADVATSVGVLVARHEGLRTTYPDARPPIQRVAAAGEFTFEVYQAGPDLSGAELQQELFARLLARSMELSELPLRIAVAVRSGFVVGVVFACSHLAADYQAMAILQSEFNHLLADPAARVVGPDRFQPLDRARVEQRPVYRRRFDAAIRRWADVTCQMPTQLYARPRVGPAGAAGALSLTSPAGRLAVDHISARTGFSRSSVLLAAVSAVLSQRTGYARCDFPALSGNRFERELIGYIGTLVQSTIVSIEVAGAGFDMLVRRAFAAVITAHRHGMYDVHRQIVTVRRPFVARGVHANFEPLLNNLALADGSPEPPRPLDEIGAALGRTRLTWQDTAPTTVLVRYDIDWGNDHLQCAIWTGDTGLVSRDEMADLLLGLERLLVAAAGGDLTPDRIRDVVALEPIERGHGWLFLDSCWVELSEVQRLLDDALPGTAARVFEGVDGQPLVAYLAPDPLAGGAAVRTPDEAHERCMAELPGRFTAMTPRWYVLCGHAPDDLGDLAAWRGRPVLAAGPGRTLLP